MACNLSHCLAHNNAISVVFPFLDHKSWLLFFAAPVCAFRRGCLIRFIFLFFTIMLDVAMSMDITFAHIASSCWLRSFFFSYFNPEITPPPLQHILSCSARLFYFFSLVSLNHVVTIWCDGCVQTNYRWWYWKPQKKMWVERERRWKKWFCVTKFEAVVIVGWAQLTEWVFVSAL